VNEPSSGVRTPEASGRRSNAIDDQVQEARYHFQKMRLLLGLTAAVISGALATTAMAAAPASCRELPVAQAKRILGPGVMLAQSGDRAGYGLRERSICSVSFSFGATVIVIFGESAQGFQPQMDYYRRRVETGRVKRLVSIRLGDEGYSLDQYLPPGFVKRFESHNLVFRVGGRFFRIEDLGTRRSITAAKRLALAKAIVATARSRP
jgi:hypothetical protein